MWAQVDGDAIVSASLDPPAGDDWLQVADVARPDDTDEHTWDAGVALVGGMPVQTWTARPWTDAEWAQMPMERRERLQRDRLRAELRDTVLAGLEALTAAREAAESDIPIAEDLIAQAQAMEAALADLGASVAGYSPAATYQAAQLDQVKAVLAQVVATQSIIASALAELYGYRRANNEVAVIAHRSLEFLARVLFEVDS